MDNPIYPNLAQPFHRQATLRPNHLALWVGGIEYTYGELALIASRIAAWLTSTTKPVARVAIIASRSLEAYAGILGTAWAGAAYVPISPQVPPARIAKILELAHVDAVITDSAGLATLPPEIIAHGNYRILSPNQAMSMHGGQTEVFGADTLSRDPLSSPIVKTGDDLAYIMFTSGTTGIPKGVMVTIGNVIAVLAAMQDRLQMGPEDRVSQSYELTFDLSVADLFWTWSTGASLHVVPAQEVMAPDHFIRRRSLSVWSSVPSTIAILNKMRRLKPGVFPSLRYSWFCGEPLPITSAVAWQQAAPISIVDNLYGPTEATVACMGYRLSELPLVTPERQVLSIGIPFPGTEVAIVNPKFEFQPQGTVGELALSGIQLARGYLDDPEKTAARFPNISARRWYLTGDLAYQDASGAFHHLGRIDHQVKILGHRVELEEVESHLRDVSGAGMAAAVAWPLEELAARGLVGFVSGAALPIEDIRNMLKERVPPYMVPARIISLETFPLTSSGKVDRKALLRMLDEQVAYESSNSPS